MVLMNGKFQATDLKKKICRNIAKNFKFFIKQSIQRIESDITKDAEFRCVFNLRRTDRISSITILGEETHNKGKNPLLVVIKLNNQRRIVFKPRSMIAEKIICGHENSVFEAFDLPKYRIYNKDGQNYGYCEFLENSEEENTFDTPAEIKKYLSIFVQMDQVAKFFGVSDLHLHNIVTSRKVPYIVDQEVIVPKVEASYSSGLLRGLTAGYLFESTSHNRIWINPELLEEESPLKAAFFSSMDSAYVLNTLNVLNVLQEEPPPFTAEQEEILQKAKQELDHHQHRIILIGTPDLVACIQKPLQEGVESFQKKLSEGLEAWEFEAVDPDGQLQKKIEEDIINNDVPIFYYIPSTGEVYYHDLLIAKRA